MNHTCKEFWNMVDRAKEFGCTVISTKHGSVKVIPKDKTLPMYTCHESDRAIHPLRRYLKNTCKFEVS